MSLARLAVRLATVQTLAPSTMVPANRVFDSSLAPIDEQAAGAEKPFIVVYTDDGAFTPVGRDLLSPNGSFSLVIEYAFTSRMKMDDGTEVWGSPETDTGMEMVLDQIERQIKIALSDPRREPDAGSDPWPDMWRRLVVNVASIRAERGGGGKDSPRFAARQLTLDVRPVAEPPFGPAAQGVWADFFALLRASPGSLPALADRLERTVSGDRAGWQVDQSQIAASNAEAGAMLITAPYDEMGDVLVSEVVPPSAQPQP